MPSYKSEKLKTVEDEILMEAVTDEELKEFTLPDFEPAFSE